MSTHHTPHDISHLSPPRKLGVQLGGVGFLLTPAERDALVAKDPTNEIVLR